MASTVMPYSNGTSGLGGVRNLRAIFEHQGTEDQSSSPPSRGRSPAHSDASIHSRPVSKVRAAFVAVERPGGISEGQQWGLRKPSDIASMADTKQEDLVRAPLDDTPSAPDVASMEDIKQENLDRAPLDDAPDPPNAPSQLNGTHIASDTPAQEDNAMETTQAELGDILKGSAFETISPTTRLQPNGSERGPPKSPTAQKQNTAAPRMNGKPISSEQPKSVGSKIKDAVPSGHNQTPPSTNLNTKKGAKPIEPPPTSHMAPSQTSINSPTLPKTPKTPVSPSLAKSATKGSSATSKAIHESARNATSPFSPKVEKPATRGSAFKPMAVAQSAENAISPKQSRTSPTLPPKPGRPAFGTQNKATTGRGITSPKTAKLNRDAAARSHEAKPRVARVPASLTAPTAASAARTSDTTSLVRKPTNAARDRQPPKAASSTAIASKKSRTSLPLQSNGDDGSKRRTSAASKAPGEGFLARMMRPTASSAQKAHERVAPQSPPRSKRPAPATMAKQKSRKSLGKPEEDKENEHRGGQDADPFVSASTQGPEVSDVGNLASQPLKDITPAVETDDGPSNPHPNGEESSTA